MIRVTIEDGEADVLFLKVEGKLVEPWTAELESAWSQLQPCRKRIRMDVTGLTFIDRKGKEVLREIARATDAEVIADSPLTRHFAREILDRIDKQEG